MMLLKWCTQHASKFGKLSRGHRTGKRSAFIPIPKKGNAKECSNYRATALISHASKVMLKILQARLQQYIYQELSDVQAGFRKGKRNQRSNCQHLLDHRKSKTIPEKHLTSASLTMLKSLTVGITTNWKRWEYQTILSASWEVCMQVKKQQLKMEMEQWTGSKLGKEYVKAVYCHPAYLTYMQSTSCKMLGWLKDKLESRLPGEIAITTDMQITPLLQQKVMRN